MEAFWRILTLPTGAGYIATDRRSGGATPVGLILSQSAADSCDILTLCVRPAFRRRGIATRLLDTMMTDRATVGASDKTDFLLSAAVPVITVMKTRPWMLSSIEAG